jgi:Zn-dependent protease with chaperone function
MSSPSVAADPVTTGPGRRGAVTDAVAAVVGLALVCGVVVAIVVAWWAGLLAAAVVGAGIGFGFVAPRVRAAEERALRLVGPARPADPRAEARLLNLVEGLSPGAGLARPRVLVIDDGVPNALAIGRDGQRGCVVATTGLLAALDRMELEGVVADLLVEIRDGLCAGPTVSLALRPGHTPAPPPLARADAAAVSLTRYPPGLTSALRQLLRAGPAVPASASPALRPLWLAGPEDADGVAARISTLEEL